MKTEDEFLLTFICLTEVKMVKQMPTQHGGQNPTVAIITANYYEKLAVDSMMENKTTFVRYKTEGEESINEMNYAWY